MKFVKKLTALFLAIVMTMAMGITAFAADTYKITINGDSKHQYEAYQIFTGSLSENQQTLSNIQWGTGVDGDGLLEALKADTKIGSDFTDCTTAADVAKVLSDKKVNETEDNKYASDSDALIAFSKIVGQHLSTTTSGTFAETKLTDGEGKETGKSTYVNSGLAVGYYFVKDRDNSAPSDDAYTRYILQLVKDVTVNAKVDVPSIDKEVKDGENWDKANTAGVGDKVEYKVTSKVPDMTGYVKYFFVLNDEMKGITFNNDVKVTIGGDELDNSDGSKYTVTTTPVTKKDADGNDVVTGSKVEIVFKDFIQYKAQKDAAIVVTYSGTVNQYADITTTGNVNEVKLTYSNNPNVTPSGDPENPDKPGPQDPKGETPKSETKTYVTGIKLVKVDGADQTALSGAKFKITGTKLNVVLVNEEIFKKDAAGSYWMLKDGSYTTTAPTITVKDNDGNVTTQGNEDKYDDLTQKYSKVTEVKQDTVKTEFQAEGYVNSDGVLTFEGLGSGDYTITELVAPDGYNKLSGPITVTITDKATFEKPDWTVTAKYQDKDLACSLDGNLYKFTVENNKGSILPSTGGMGTTVIYIAGIAMIVAAGVVVIARKRMA